MIVFFQLSATLLQVAIQAIALLSRVGRALGVGASGGRWLRGAFANAIPLKLSVSFLF